MLDGLVVYQYGLVLVRRLTVAVWFGSLRVYLDNGTARHWRAVESSMSLMNMQIPLLPVRVRAS